MGRQVAWSNKLVEEVEDISEDLNCRSEKFGRGLREIGVEAKQRVVMFAETRSVLRDANRQFFPQKF